MFPVLFQFGGVPVRGYAVFVGLAVVAAFLVRRSEVRRLGYDSRNEGHRWVGVGALAGAVVGAKLGMVLFEEPAAVATVWARVWSLDFGGKTVVGGLAGGYAGVEIAKRLAGIRHSTGDAFAVALPLAQGLGRVGCFLEGCCYGAPTGLPWAVDLHGAARHPVQLYEATLDLALAGALFSLRDRGYPEGHLFRRYLVGYALVRFALEPLRGDPVRHLGPFTSVQWVCLAAALCFGALVVVRERRIA